MKGVELYHEHYRIENEISKGGFATIYKAEEKGRHQPVAIKLGKVHKDPAYAMSITAEAKIIHRLNHRNIVEIFPIPRHKKADIYYARAMRLDGRPYFFVMEYLAGGTLSDYLDQVGSLPPDETAAIGLEIGRALDHMHRSGYAHNDLKMENIVFRSPVEVGQPYSPVLIDFGIATRIQPPGALSVYIAPPEQLKQLKMIDPPELEQEIDRTKVDVWGLGVVLYRMLGGKLPFTGRSEKRITDLIINSRPTALYELSEFASPEWDELIVDGCLAKDPSHRLSMLELGKALKPFAAGAVASKKAQPQKKSSWWQRLGF